MTPLNIIELHIRVIEQNTRALDWLTNHAERPVFPEPFRISPQTVGSGLTGFADAERLLNDYMRVHHEAMLDYAIAAAKTNIEISKAEIRKASKEL